jgi:hypothetical protein
LLRPDIRWLAGSLLATEIVRRIEDGGLTAEAVAASFLERIALREPVAGAWAHLAGHPASRERSARPSLSRSI